MAFVWTLDHEARGFQEQVYLDWREALEALGLSEWVMSQENVEVVRRWIDGYNHRDMEGLVALTSPELAVQSVFGFDFRGYEGLRAYFMELDGAYDDFQVVPSGLIDAGAAVVMVAQAKWRGKDSTAEGETSVQVAFWFRVGRVFGIETFRDRRDALEAVGLSE